MSIETQVLALFEEANPVPDIETLEPIHVDAAAYLATLTSGSSAVTQLDTKAEEKQKDRRPVAWLVAAVAVVIVGVVVIVLSQGETEVPPVTDPTPTTVLDAAPTTVGEEPLSPELDTALATAIVFVEAIADRDAETAAQNAIQGQIVGLMGSSLERMPDEFGWMEAVGWTMEVDECALDNPDLANTRIHCTVIHQNALSEVLGVGPYQGGFTVRIGHPGDTWGLTITLAEATVAEFFPVDFPVGAFSAETWNPFIRWLEVNHPEVVGAMFLPDDMLSLAMEPLPRLTPESVELWQTYTAEFVAEQSQ